MLRYLISCLTAIVLACYCAPQGAFAQGDEAAAEHAAASHEAGGEEHGGSKIPELPNLLGTVHNILHATSPETAEKMTEIAKSTGLNDPMGDAFTAVETLLASWLVIALLVGFFYSCYKRLSHDPRAAGRISKRAMFAEVVVLFFEDFFAQIFGKADVRKHLPFVGTLFIYILCCNNLGLVFLGKAPTANLSFNLGMAILVFGYVHGSAILKNPLGWLAHFPGALPTAKELGMGPMSYVLIGFMGTLFVIIHIMEMFIQPVSLSLRLFGNLLGKDVLLGVFGGLIHYVPLQTPFLFLGLLLGSVQALIFSLLSAVYITLWQPHEHHHEEQGHEAGHGAHPAGAH